ncbi:hypothetical protein OGATHE_005020 [Ogataea polymorpha]|uniref:Uncharacterized protein n=1 Tax=Ogataea polymorpha TaxID=460523 RepID=A0A9P8NVM2_9ASCO|nr:hypothetical protein OGATHE_005020 [Ogataea polymorpha]
MLLIRSGPPGMVADTQKSPDSNSLELEFSIRLTIFWAPSEGSKNISFILGSFLKLICFDKSYLSMCGLTRSKSSSLCERTVARTSMRKIGVSKYFGLLLSDLRNFSVRRMPGAMMQLREFVGCSTTLIPTLLRFRRSEALNS